MLVRLYPFEYTKYIFDIEIEFIFESQILMVCVGLLVHRIHILLVLESKTKNNNMRKKSEIISRDHRLPTSPIYKILCKKSLIKNVS